MEQQLNVPRPHYALLVHDILVVIELLKDDPPTLFAAARTCRLRAAAAIRKLWRAPLFDALAQNLTAKRRQMLAPTVRNVSLLPGEHRWQAGISDALVMVRRIAEWHLPAARTCDLAAALMGCVPGSYLALLLPSYDRIMAAAIRSLPVSVVLNILLDA